MPALTPRPPSARTNESATDGHADTGGSSGAPQWARGGVPWRAIREVFDERLRTVVEEEDEFDQAHINATLVKYNRMYHEVGLAYLNDSCAALSPNIEIRRSPVRDRAAATSSRSL